MILRMKKWKKGIGKWVDNYEGGWCDSVCVLKECIKVVRLFFVVVNFLDVGVWVLFFLSGGEGGVECHFFL